VTRELQQLLAALEHQRAAVLKKLAGLSDDDARRSTVGSGTNVAGIVQHLTFVESKWFEGIVAGRTPNRGRRSMEVDRSVSLRALRSEYRSACEASNEIVASVGAAPAKGAWPAKPAGWSNWSPNDAVNAGSSVGEM